MSARVTKDELAALSKTIYNDGRYSLSFLRLEPDNRAPVIDGVVIEDSVEGTHENLLFKRMDKKLVEVSKAGPSTQPGIDLYHSYKKFDGSGPIAIQYQQNSSPKQHQFSRSQYMDRNGKNPIIETSRNIPENQTFFDFVEEKEVMQRARDIMLGADDKEAPASLLAQKKAMLRYIKFNIDREFPALLIH